MTWSPTLAEPSRAGANSKPHHYKQNVRKTKDTPTPWVLTGKRFEDFRRKEEQKRNFQPFKNSQWNTWPLNTRYSSNFCASF